MPPLKRAGLGRAAERTRETCAAALIVLVPVVLWSIAHPSAAWLLGAILTVAIPGLLLGRDLARWAEGLLTLLLVGQGLFHMWCVLAGTGAPAPEIGITAWHLGLACLSLGVVRVGGRTLVWHAWQTAAREATRWHDQVPSGVVEAPAAPDHSVARFINAMTSPTWSMRAPPTAAGA